MNYWRVLNIFFVEQIMVSVIQGRLSLHNFFFMMIMQICRSGSRRHHDFPSSILIQVSTTAAWDYYCQGQLAGSPIRFLFPTVNIPQPPPQPLLLLLLCSGCSRRQQHWHIVTASFFDLCTNFSDDAAPDDAASPREPLQSRTKMRIFEDEEFLISNQFFLEVKRSFFLFCSLFTKIHS